MPADDMIAATEDDMIAATERGTSARPPWQLADQMRVRARELTGLAVKGEGRGTLITAVC